jgi:hypothetical protein
MLTPESAERIERSLNAAIESRIVSVGRLPENPLGVERQEWGSLSSTLVMGDAAYYHYFSAIRGVRPGSEADFDEALAWFRENKRECSVAVSPWFADEALLSHLANRGLRQSRFMSVLYGNPGSLDATNLSDVNVRLLERGNREDFHRLWLPDMPAEEQGFLRSLVQAEFVDWRCYVAYIDEHPAAYGCLHLGDGAAMLASAWTAPEFRERGCQTALIQRRIADAAEADCDLIVSQAVPGSQSERNMMRVGLQLAYTQAIWLSEP